MKSIVLRRVSNSAIWYNRRVSSFRCSSLTSLSCLFMRPLQRPAPPLLLYTSVLFFTTSCPRTSFVSPFFRRLLFPSYSLLFHLLRPHPYPTPCNIFRAALHSTTRCSTVRYSTYSGHTVDRAGQATAGTVVQSHINGLILCSIIMLLFSNALMTHF